VPLTFVSTPTIGVIGAPGLDVLLRSFGFRIVGGTPARASATEISQIMLEGDGAFPVVVTDSAQYAILRHWVAAMNDRTTIVVLATTSATGMLSGHPGVVRLPATLNDVLAAIGYQRSARPEGDLLLDADSASVAKPEPEPRTEALPVAEAAMTPEQLLDLIDDDESPEELAPSAPEDRAVVEDPLAGFPDDLFVESLAPRRAPLEPVVLEDALTIASEPAGFTAPEPPRRARARHAAAPQVPEYVETPSEHEPYAPRRAVASTPDAEWEHEVDQELVIPAPDWDQTHHTGVESGIPRFPEPPSPASPLAEPAAPPPPAFSAAQASEPAGWQPRPAPAFLAPLAAATPYSSPVAPARAYPNAGRCTTIIVAAGKGGVGKTTAAIRLAYRGARRGLRVVLVDANRGQADVRKYLKLTKANLRTAYDGVIDPAAAILRPNDYGAIRAEQRLPVPEFAIVLGPPADYADPAYVPASAYARIVDAAQAAADLVIIDTQIVEAARTDLWNEMALPLLGAGAWLLGLTDASSPGVSNLSDRLGELVRDGVGTARTMILASGYTTFTPHDSAFFAQKFNQLGTFVGATGDDPKLAEDMSFGRLMDSALVDPVLDAVLDRALGVPAPAGAPAKKPSRWGRR